MGIYGYSRGGMAASLLAVKLDDVQAVVLSAGIYDFKEAYDEVTQGHPGVISRALCVLIPLTDSPVERSGLGGVRATAIPLSEGHAPPRTNRCG
jgi:hypothetical protein